VVSVSIEVSADPSDDFQALVECACKHLSASLWKLRSHHGKKYGIRQLALVVGDEQPVLEVLNSLTGKHASMFVNCSWERHAHVASELAERRRISNVLRRKKATLLTSAECVSSCANELSRPIECRQRRNASGRVA
jgi:hypothetical protein